MRRFAHYSMMPLMKPKSPSYDRTDALSEAIFADINNYLVEVYKYHKAAWWMRLGELN